MELQLSNEQTKIKFFFEYTTHNQKIIERLSRIGYYIKGFSLTLFGAILGIYFSINFPNDANRILFLVSMILVFLIFWITDVINLKNEKIFRLDYSYKLKNWKKMDYEEIFDVAYYFKKIEKKQKKLQWKKSIFNWFTLINLILSIPFFILIFI